MNNLPNAAVQSQLNQISHKISAYAHLDPSSHKSPLNQMLVSLSTEFKK
jgi:hypothetical protein